LALPALRNQFKNAKQKKPQHIHTVSTKCAHHACPQTICGAATNVAADPESGFDPHDTAHDETQRSAAACATCNTHSHGAESKWVVVRNALRSGALLGGEVLVARTFERLFAGDYLGVVPVMAHQARCQCPTRCVRSEFLPASSDQKKAHDILGERYT
jgi:hypothetical protein